MDKEQAHRMQQLAGPEPPGAPQTAGRAALAALNQPGRVSGVIVTGAPGIVFVAADAQWSPRWPGSPGGWPATRACGSRSRA